MVVGFFAFSFIAGLNVRKGIGVSGSKVLPLTVIITTFNVEHCIEDCLKSVCGWVDEVLVIDSFSTDRTMELVSRYADRVLQHEYITHAAQCNWAIPQARHEWVLLIDSDEVVTSQLKAEIQNLFDLGLEREGYWIYRNNHLLGRRIRHSGWGRDSVLRLFLRDKARYPEKRVHPEFSLENTGVLHGRLEHYTVSSISDWAAKINSYSSLKAADKFEHGFPLPHLQLLIRPFWRFFKDTILRLGFLDGWRGFLIAGMSALAEMQMSAKVLELKYQSNRSGKLELKDCSEKK